MNCKTSNKLKLSLYVSHFKQKLIWSFGWVGMAVDRVDSRCTCGISGWHRDEVCLRALFIK